MRPKRFPTHNTVFELSGGNEDNTLFVEAFQDQDGNPVLMSVWEPSEEDRRLIAAGATIELGVIGLGHPPVWMRVGPSIEQRREAGGR